jgi:hypothetical protein
MPTTEEAGGAEEAQAREVAPKWRQLERTKSGHHTAAGLPFQPKVKAIYENQKVEVFVACLIFGNFFMQCLQNQLDPGPTLYVQYWSRSEDFFNVMFLVELLVNAYGRWFRPFLQSWWNYFDVLVVAIGVLDLAQVELYGPLKMLRMARAFRVFRLFGKVESLRKIIKSLQRALPGVVNSFGMILLMMCIYAVLAVEFFKDVYGDCLDGTHGDKFYFGETPRGLCVGPEYYGKFLPALYTLFQVLTGESWSEFCVRPLLIAFEHSVTSTFGVAVFFISFILVNYIVLLNVVVAVLLDGMQKEKKETDDKAKADAASSDQKEADSAAAKKDPRQELASVRQEIAAMKAQLAFTQQAVNGQLADVLGALKLTS